LLSEPVTRASQLRVWAIHLSHEKSKIIVIIRNPDDLGFNGRPQVDIPCRLVHLQNGLQKWLLPVSLHLSHFD